jgi:predicted RecB family nuclease
MVTITKSLIEMGMRLSASELYRLYKPSNCELRLYLHHKGVEEAKPGPFGKVIRRLGERHEKLHLATFDKVLDLGAGTFQERQAATLEAIGQRAPVIYQALFRVTAQLAGRDYEVVGAPDFLIESDGAYLVRDAKLARRIDRTHPEILWQLRLYGWLYSRAVGQPIARLEVYNGAGEVVVIEPVADADVEQELTRYVRVMETAEPPFAPVGWSKCGSCGYHDRCWTAAEALHDVALVPRVDQALVRALRESGVVSYDDLLAQFDEQRLAAFDRGHGGRTRKVGTAATPILRSAQALASGSEVVIQAPAIPQARNYAMFDLEGLPPQLDELEKIYLWGIQVYGAEPSEYMGATAGFGPDGDREGWQAFLSNARRLLHSYGNIPFVHWHQYERVKLDLYVARYGDPDGTANAIRSNVFDLLPATQNAVALPLPSYSLKVVEDYVGFERTQTDYGGEWAMARYIEATETSDECVRQSLVSDIKEYNREDLAATWAVFCWLQELGTRLRDREFARQQ